MKKVITMILLTVLARCCLPTRRAVIPRQKALVHLLHAAMVSSGW